MASSKKQGKPLVIVESPAKARTIGKFLGSSYRIEDHFQEIPEVPDKLPFKCPCGRRLVTRPNMIDKRGKCPWCQARLLLVGKVNPKTKKLEIHPLVIETPRSGDTMMLG